MDDDSSVEETEMYINKLKESLRYLEDVDDSDSIEITASNFSSSTDDMIEAYPHDDETLKIEIVRSDSSQEDTVMQLFSCLRDLNLTVKHANVSTNAYGIHATITVQPSDTSTDQYTLCSEIEEALQRYLP
ncbi:hypothetical protein MPTK1_2g02460 [Marchantia polymorpha subsp. ruderalis]|uniref:ACT domain-containing protein n=1 Tax=Marchantia polymorpha TaxID=3197 RepID=A0A2R6WLZ8_MARPO|nr:hypothetical protein MARPO_0075s0008 [Marchantia polymorpha]BBN00827.1 hypothetical protein Mp_2g02460 [Marchantia polymorpha subsp. ruderalis]|eukprot:PTQ34880.1 hypothetical protein MARPO_0075s0008 [Marchantia polymorpha]